jgi:tetratricopeptide (TPR) repeat protein
MITVIAIGYIFALFLEAQPASQQLFEIPEAIIPIVAFLIGYIPESGIRLFRVISSRYFKPDDRSELTLGKVGGISIWHETRLRESGVDNVQNLAAMDIRQLLLTSRYSMQQVMNWVDQAILLTTLPEKTISFLQANGITTMTALIRLVAPIPTAEPEQIRLSPIDENAELTHDELVLLATFVRSVIESSPNLAYMQAYWEAIRKVETEQIRAQAKNVLSDITRQVASPVFASDQTLDLLSNLVKASAFEAKDLIDAFAKDAASAVGLANAYIENDSYGEAINILTVTIEEYRYRDEDISSAYACRGLAHGFLAMKYTPGEKEFTENIHKSDKDFKTAIKNNPKYPVTYIYQGALMLQRKEFKDALNALDQAIELDPTIPKAFLTRGKIRSNLNQYDQAITDFSDAIRLAKARDLQRIMEDAYYERATLYLNSAKPDEAKRDFDDEIFLDSRNPQAYLGRGKALLLRGSRTLELSGNITSAVLFLLSRAINDFETTIELFLRQQKERRSERLDPNAALAYSNIAQAYFLLEQYIDAVTNIQKAIDLGDQSLINLKLRGLSYIKIGELEKALGDLTQYLGNLPKESPERQPMQQIIESVQKKIAAQAAPAPAAQP